MVMGRSMVLSMIALIVLCSISYYSGQKAVNVEKTHIEERTHTYYDPHSSSRHIFEGVHHKPPRGVHSKVFNLKPYRDMKGKEEQASKPRDKVKARVNEKEKEQKEVAVVVPESMSGTELGLTLKDHATWVSRQRGRFSRIKTFFGTGRTDFTCPIGSMCKVLGRVGIAPVEENTVEHTQGALYWGIQFKPENIDKFVFTFSKGQYAGINMFPGLAFLGDKLNLGSTLNECVEDLGIEVCDFIPLSFQIPAEYLKWSTFVKKNPEGYWIVKPRGGYSSVGIKVIESHQSIPNPGESITDREWAVQQYVYSPLLFMNHKFDMRVWALVTSLDPLRIYLNQDAFPKVATSEFSPDTSQFSDLCIHLTSPTKACSRDFLKHVPDCVRDAWFQKQLSVQDPSKPVPSWENVVWPSLERAVVKTVLMGMPLALKTDEELHRAVKNYEGFAHLSFDVIVEDTGHAFVEEVNFNGFLEFQRGMNGGAKGGDYLENEMRILGLGNGGYDRSGYQKMFMQRLTSFCQGYNCTSDDMRTLQGLMDEDGAHAKYKRVFPPPEGVAEMGYDVFFNQRDARNMTVSRANQVTWAYVDFLRDSGVVKPARSKRWSDLGPAIDPADREELGEVTAGLKKSKPSGREM